MINNNIAVINNNSKEERIMTQQEIIDIIKNKNGRFTSITWESNQARKMSAIYKADPMVNLTKVTKLTARADVKYENTKEYDKHDHDIPSWQERVEGCDGLVRHKKTGKLYLQIYPTHNKNQMSSQYYLNGEPISKEEALEMFQPSQRNKPSDSNIICIALDDIKSIG